jgi:hypothetical protein
MVASKKEEQTTWTSDVYYGKDAIDDMWNLIVKRLKAHPSPTRGESSRQILWKWGQFASIGVYGGNGTIRALRIWKVPWRRFYPRFTKRCTFGLQLMCTLCRLVLITFLLAFLILFRCFLCILPLYQGVPYAFNEIDFLLINKKKKLGCTFGPLGHILVGYVTWVFI